MTRETIIIERIIAERQIIITERDGDQPPVTLPPLLLTDQRRPPLIAPRKLLARKAA